MTKYNFSAYLERLATAMSKISNEALDAAAAALYSCYLSESSTYVIGNGGSATTAGHMACDLSKGPTQPEKKGLKTWSLADNIAYLTALANDTGYENAFAFPIRQYAKAGDVLIAISASGNSPNIIAAVEVAKAKAMTVIGMSGFSGGKLKTLADVSLHVASDSYGVVEDGHLICNHYLVEALRAKMQERSLDFN